MFLAIFLLFGEFGNHDGRPKNKSDKLNFAEIIAFLKSKKLNPVYPARVRGKRENRRSFKKKCKQFRLVKNILHRKVKVRAVEQYVRVAEPKEVNRKLFLQYHFSGLGCDNTMGLNHLQTEL